MLMLPSDFPKTFGPLNAKVHDYVKKYPNWLVWFLFYKFNYLFYSLFIYKYCRLV